MSLTQAIKARIAHELSEPIQDTPEWLQHQLDILRVEALREDARRRDFTRWELKVLDSRISTSFLPY